MSTLDGKTALITGGTSGIGLAVAARYAQLGARVVIAGRREDGDEIARVAGCEFVALDVRDEDAVAAVHEQVGGLDVLVLNAGAGHAPTSLADTPSKRAKLVVDINLFGTFWGLKHGGPQMHDGGSIVITSSIAAVMGTSFEGLYGATKAAVSALARSAAIDLGPRGIRVNAVQPGPTWTDMNAMPEGLFEVMAPMGRKATVDDLVGLYVFLASDESRYLTGQAISVDGGLTLGVSGALLGLVASQMEVRS